MRLKEIGKWHCAQVPDAGLVKCPVVLLNHSFIFRAAFCPTVGGDQVQVHQMRVLASRWLILPALPPMALPTEVLVPRNRHRPSFS